MNRSATHSGAAPAAGSYRDPSGFVFIDSGSVYRAVSDAKWPLFEEIRNSGVLDTLMRAGDLVGSTVVDPDGAEQARLKAQLPGWNHFCRHEKIELLSFPYEWCYSMLADAGLLHLAMQRALLGKGFSLKDATAFNVQFVGARPVFIDLLSIERPGRLDVWVAYSQFCRMFLYPLLLHLHKGLTSRHLFLPSLEGPDAGQTARLLGRWGSLRPDAFMDVWLARAFERKESDKTRALRSEMAKEGTKPDAQLMNLDRLERKLGALKTRYNLSGHWADYERTNTYNTEARTEKAAAIRAFLERQKPGTVLDVGCNTGTYSVMAAESGAKVVSVDSDHDCVEALYRTARERKLNILPLVVDISNPSPAVGFQNGERERFLDRVSADAVLALALVHHLLITARIPLDGIRDLFHGLTRKWLVIEFVDRDDPMFQTLLALREDLYKDWTLDVFL
ncbi:MAG TPA: class I SAM-dependent methyltransferase, partial [Kiritimatiellia bacterium]